MKRRDILKKAGAGVAASVAVTGVASARRTVSDGQKAALEQPDTVRDTLQAHEHVLDGLVEEGMLDTTDLDEFDLQSRSGPQESGDGIAVLTAERGSRETPMVVTSRMVDDGMVTIHVLPEENRSFALLRDSDGEVRDGLGAEVSTSDLCSTCYDAYCSCEQDGCGGCCQYTCYCICDCYDCPYTCNLCAE